MQHLRIAAVGARRESASTPPRADSGRSITNVLLSLVCLALPIYADVTFGQPPDPGIGNVFPFGSSYNAEYQHYPRTFVPPNPGCGTVAVGRWSVCGREAADTRAARIKAGMTWAVLPHNVMLQRSPDSDSSPPISS
jgi:hypothetical protein